jgi:hypothetical protein
VSTNPQSVEKYDVTVACEDTGLNRPSVLPRPDVKRQLNHESLPTPGLWLSDSSVRIGAPSKLADGFLVSTREESAMSGFTSLFLKTNAKAVICISIFVVRNNAGSATVLPITEVEFLIEYQSINVPKLLRHVPVLVTGNLIQLSVKGISRP